DLLARFAATAPAAFAGSRRSGPARFTGPVLGLGDAGRGDAGLTAPAPAPRRAAARGPVPGPRTAAEAEAEATEPSRRAGTLRRPRVRVPRPRIVPAELEVC
ncbi:hypothetical protein, partial [Micromonospora fulviviridis]|uniref:hypothetical protein n=1 Tax=Micromonospora fulviviridis TaxID=47860 RepID=UPI001E3DDED3